MFGRLQGWASADRAEIGQRRPGVLKAVLESLERRRHFAVDVGWTAAMEGFTLSYGYLDEGRTESTVVLTGTPGDDIVYVRVDPADPTLVDLSLNGAGYTLNASDFPANTSLQILGAKATT